MYVIELVAPIYDFLQGHGSVLVSIAGQTTTVGSTVTYFLEGSFRRDGSSRFHKDNRWGNFYSVGASWNMKQESFLQDVDWLDALKLRASYGEVGNNISYAIWRLLR